MFLDAWFFNIIMNIFTQKEDSTENEDNDNEKEDAKEDEEGEEEEDISDENYQPEESGDSLDAASDVHETEISRDKKRGNKQIHLKTN